jgi:hypothetical protein
MAARTFLENSIGPGMKVSFLDMIGVVGVGVDIDSNPILYP